MKSLLLLSATILLLAVLSNAQSKPNDAILQQIKFLKAEKTLELTYDQNSNTSKLKAVAENFSSGDAKKSGILAMNFAVGFHYAGPELKKSPDPILLTFWVLTKKPRFGEDHSFTVVAGDEMLVLGNARYVAKTQQNMEYLNFEISRADLAKIAAQRDVRFKLGPAEFQFTPSQLKLFADILAVSEMAR
jgi:hypothetical protein